MLVKPLITGYKDIRDLAKDSKVKIRGGKQATRLIEVLFPNGFPYGGYPPFVWE